jgi:mevalonate pyrophosphate decarboxylase
MAAPQEGVPVAGPASSSSSAAAVAAAGGGAAPMDEKKDTLNLKVKSQDGKPMKAMDQR